MMTGLIALWVVLGFVSWEQDRHADRIRKLEKRIEDLEAGTVPARWPE